jgi:hypothetical protein
MPPVGFEPTIPASARLQTYALGMCRQTPISNTYIASPTLSAPRSLWTEMPYYTVFHYSATLDTLPQIVANKQRRYIWGGGNYI